VPLWFQSKHKKIIHAIALNEIVLFRQDVTRLADFLDHNLAGDAVVFSVADAVNYADPGSRSKLLLRKLNFIAVENETRVLRNLDNAQNPSQHTRCWRTDGASLCKRLIATVDIAFGCRNSEKAVGVSAFAAMQPSARLFCARVPKD
jgi:hypothetical protein